jgi:hypothetical protein
VRIQQKVSRLETARIVSNVWSKLAGSISPLGNAVKRDALKMWLARAAVLDMAANRMYPVGNANQGPSEASGRLGRLRKSCDI